VVAVLGVCTGLFLACSTDPPKFNDGELTAGTAGKTDASGGTGADDAGGSSATAGKNSQAGKPGAGEANGGGGLGGGGGTGNSGCEPGATQPCYESPDGKSYGAVPAKAVGACKIGASTCSSDGKWSACIGAVPPQAADNCEPGNDANCNDKPNEGCTCANGDSRDCGSDVGSCKKGKQTCADATWGACVGEVKAAAADTCDLGNDANCNGSANNGCECTNGTKQACGSAIGNCKKGEQTCTNGVWGTCTGGVTPQAADKCAPAGDDANCNGVANENCDCTAGATRPCAKCGTQTCGSDGKWPTTCSGSKECEPGDVKTGSVACGNCGTQSTKQTCSNACTYGAVTNVGTCLGSGPCQPGVTADQTQNIVCGNCGSQKQTRACTAACDWPATWTNSGSCTGSGCVPGSSVPDVVQPCGYCGEQAKKRVCDNTCKLGAIVNDGTCLQKECNTMPGDERPGYVTCIHPAPDFNSDCLPSQKCCLTTSGGYSCNASCGATDIYSTCDGPEDCPAGNACCSQYDPNENTYSYCTANCQFNTKCHADSDCPPLNGFSWHCSKYTTGSYHNGVCYVNGSNP
jgi:hypothetical protein